MADLPFTPFDAPLKEVLARSYIVPVTRWLSGTQPDTVLAQAGNSAWEAAMSVDFFTQALSILRDANPAPDLLEVIPRKSANVVRWLLELKREMPGGPYVSWEGVTWDTSVIIRTVLGAMHLLRTEERQAVEDAAVASCNWLLSRFQRWKEEVKYPFGPADVAQILMTLVFVIERFPELYRRIAAAYEPQTPPSPLSLCRYIAEYLVRDCTREHSAADHSSGPIEIAYWLDGFNTAEVVEALGLYYHLVVPQPPLQIQEERDALRVHLSEVRDVLKGAYQWFEHVQSEDGTWGAAFDTSRILQTYVRLPHLAYGMVDAMPYRVFKTLRWLCDEKQIFSDGSYQHTDFITTFYSHALISVYTSWELADRTVAELYDDVLWMAPTRASPERSQRLALEVSVATLKEESTRLASDGEYWHAQAETAEIEVIKLRFIGLATVVMFVATWIVADDLGVLKTQFTIPNSEVGNFLQFLAVALVIYGAVVGLLWGLPFGRRRGTKAFSLRPKRASRR